MKIHTVLQSVLDLLYPPRCPICDEILPLGRKRTYGMEKTPEEVISAFWCCEKCGNRLPWVREPACMKCGKPIGREEAESCSDCQGEAHYFDRGRAAFRYTDEMKRSIYRLKFQNRRDSVGFYGEAMAAALVPYLEQWRPQLVVPVPMHRSKKRKRGYNQSELLAEQISRLTGIPLEKGLLRCVRKTMPQKQLGRRERRKNLRGCFTAARPLPEGERLLLVDDVYTTGSTMDEISRTLRHAGAAHIFFIVLCIGKGENAVCTAKNV